LSYWRCVLDCVVPECVLIIDPKASVIGEVPDWGGADEVLELCPNESVDIVACAFIGVDFDGVGGCHHCI